MWLNNTLIVGGLAKLPDAAIIARLDGLLAKVPMLLRDMVARTYCTFVLDNKGFL